jgi:hypothetical protein
MKSSFNRDNNYCHYVIQRTAGFAMTPYYHPAGLDAVMVVYHLLYDLLIFFLVWVDVGGWSWLVGRRESSNRRVHSMISGGFMIISTAQSQFSRWSPVIWSPTYYYVWVCLFIPFITEVITGRTKESRYCVSYQFAVLGGVVRGRVLANRFGHSNSYLFFRIRLVQVTKVLYYIMKTLFQLGAAFSLFHFVEPMCPPQFVHHHFARVF